MVPSQPGETRRAWHGVAELVLAGPQVRATGHLRLRRVPGGFGTAYGADLRVEVADLVAGAVRISLDGHSCAELAAAVGVDAGPPVGRYPDGSGVDPHEPLRVDRAAAQALATCFAIGDEALRRFHGDDHPPLWPEHFDLGVTAGEVNYGVSPGDSYVDEPYAYVGPWQPRRGDFWNVAFGAARPLRELDDADAVVAFFREGHDRAASDPPAAEPPTGDPAAVDPPA